MNRKFFAFTLLAAIGLTALTAACSENEEVARMAEKTEVADIYALDPSHLHINVSDGGFRGVVDKSPTANTRMTRSLPDTLTSDDEVFRATVFEMNDTVGIFAVDATGKVTAFNAKYKYDGQNWGSPTPIVFDATCQYFCYAPYLPDSVLTDAPLLGKQVGTNVDALTFFADMIAAWEIKPDQQSYQDYKLSDLMVGKGELDTEQENTMNFVIDHQGGLVVLNIGYVRKILRTGTYSWFEPATDSFRAASDTTETRITVPTSIRGQFRVIVPVGASVLIAANDDEWNLYCKVRQAGHYQFYGIGYDESNPTGGWSYHDLQIGDIMYNNGRIMHVTDENVVLRSQLAAQAIGFVCYVNDGSNFGQSVIDDVKDENGLPLSNYHNGLIHALRHVHGWKMELPDDYTLDTPLRFEYPSPGVACYSLSGRQMTRNYAKIDSLYYRDSLRHINSAMEVLATKPRPTGKNTPTSEWFVPAFGQTYWATRSMVEAYGEITGADQTTNLFYIDAVLGYTGFSERHVYDYGVSNFNTDPNRGGHFNTTHRNIITYFAGMSVNYAAGMYEGPYFNSDLSGNKEYVYGIYATSTPETIADGKVSKYITYGRSKDGADIRGYPYSTDAYTSYIDRGSENESRFYPYMAF